MNLYTIPFKDIKIKKGHNPRAIDLVFIEGLVTSISKHGLLQPLTCVETYDNTEDSATVKGYQVVDGEHRFHALKQLAKTQPARFEELFPEGQIGVSIRNHSASDKEALKTDAVIANLWRNSMEPHEIYAEIVRRTAAEQDQYEIAEILNLQQPRVAEFLSFRNVCEAGHEAWRKHLLSNADMVRLASLPEEDQEAFIGNLTAAVADAGDAPKDVKAAKAAARKALKAEVAEKSDKRTYANAGKPSRQTLATYVPTVAILAHESETDDERAFYNAVAAAFKIMNGELSFDKLLPGKSYVTKKELGEAKKLASEAEAYEAAKAERAERKAEKAKAKAEREKAKAAKAAKEKAAAKGEGKPAKAKKTQPSAKKSKKAAKKSKKGDA